MNNAIVCLTRGYTQRSKYSALIQRNNAIYTFLNSEVKYPLIIFHEGNITQDDQSYIASKANGQLIRFVNVNEIWVGGYESMCRFYCYHIWNYCKEFDYILRVDEDCLITRLESDPFESIGDNVYLISKYWAESHSETNATLPQAIQRETGANPAEFYNNKFPYTNIGLSSVKFWLTDPVHTVLRNLALSEDQKKNRWGDLPMLGSLLNIYAKDKVGIIKGLTYFHASHNYGVSSEDGS